MDNLAISLRDLLRNENIKIIKEELETNLEITKYLINFDEGPILLFPHVKGYKMPLLSNVLATRNRFLKILGSIFNQFTDE